MTTKPIRIGILGAAKIAPAAVIEQARGNREFEVVCVGARDPDRAKTYAEKHGIPNVARDYAELVARDDVDLVYNALPPEAHPRWSIAALKAGKAVLCEKPFCLNATLARTMVEAGNAVGRPLIEAFHYRFHPLMKRVLAIIASGELGKLLEAEARFEVPIPYREGELRWIREQGGGALMDLGTYCVHALRSVAMSEPKVTKAACRMDHGVDVGTEAELEFPGGLKARLSTSMDYKGVLPTLKVTGEKGSIDIFNFIAPQFAQRLGGCRFAVQSGAVTRQEPTMETVSTYGAQLEHVGDVLLRGAKPLTGGADSIAQMSVIDAIYAAAGVA